MLQQAVIPFDIFESRPTESQSISHNTIIVTLA